jgi:hypothetical protein
VGAMAAGAGGSGGGIRGSGGGGSVNGSGSGVDGGGVRPGPASCGLSCGIGTTHGSFLISNFSPGCHLA